MIPWNNTAEMNSQRETKMEKMDMLEKRRDFKRKQEEKKEKEVGAW